VFVCPTGGNGNRSPAVVVVKHKFEQPEFAVAGPEVRDLHRRSDGEPPNAVSLALLSSLIGVQRTSTWWSPLRHADRPVASSPPVLRTSLLGKGLRPLKSLKTRTLRPFVAKTCMSVTLLAAQAAKRWVTSHEATRSGGTKPPRKMLSPCGGGRRVGNHRVSQGDTWQTS
jgi:hypothetical protein